MWLFFSSLAFGLTGACCAKKLKKNPYLWFALGCVWKIYALLFILLPTFVGILSLFFLKKKVTKGPSFGASATEEVTIEVSPYGDLNVSPQMEKTLWYYLDSDGKTMGPMSFPAFYQARKNGLLSDKTLVWNETLSEWTSFQNVFLNK